MISDEKSGGEDDEAIATGDLIVALCDDGLAHAFQVLDDGVREKPSCGKAVKDLGPADDHDLVCIDCIRDMAKALECDISLAMRIVDQVMGEKRRRIP